MEKILAKSSVGSGRMLHRKARKDCIYVFMKMTKRSGEASKPCSAITEGTINVINASNKFDKF